jgi:hypothetical protein
MSHEQVCTWLGLPPGSWPPDHYTLLGLQPGESDLDRIEQHVHERMVLLRARQLNHPDQVTEAMNLLARAFSCLTDPIAKKTYDARLLGRPIPEEPVPGPATNPPPLIFGLVEAQVRSNWVNSSPGTVAIWTAGWLGEPSAAPTDSTALSVPSGFVFFNATVPPAEALPDANGSPPQAIPVQPPPPPVPLQRPVDHLAATARSLSARRGLGTKRALYVRIAHTRRLLVAWVRAGKYLGHPRRRVIKVKEANDLARQLDAIFYYLQGFPPLLGEAGQPGFYVTSLANQEMVVPTFRMLLPSQRETLARDWRDGHKVLTHHLQFLRQELRALRQTRWWGRFVRATDSLLSDHPSLLLILVTLIAVAVTFLLTILLPSRPFFGN